MGDDNASFWSPEQNIIEKLRKQSTPNVNGRQEIWKYVIDLFHHNFKKKSYLIFLLGGTLVFNLFFLEGFGGGMLLGFGFLTKFSVL